jgi:hypothetical protein
VVQTLKQEFEFNINLSEVLNFLLAKIKTWVIKIFTRNTNLAISNHFHQTVNQFSWAYIFLDVISSYSNPALHL